MKKITFFTIHQAPHNTYTFKCLDNLYKLDIFYLHEKMSRYAWGENDFYYPGNKKNSLAAYIVTALKSDFVIISGWMSYKYVILILLLLLLRRKFSVYLDLDPTSLRKYGVLKKILLKRIPYIFVTGVYGEKFIKKYLRKNNNVFDFPYGVALPDSKKIESINVKRMQEIKNGDKIKVFVSNRFIKRKGYGLVKYLITQLKEHAMIDDFQFFIAGNGPLFEKEKELLKKIDDSIIFLGWIEYSEYKEYMALCDVYLHCSEFEPYGIPIVDAFTHKKEIVITDKIYSRCDITELGGKVHKFNYNNEKKLFEIFEYFDKNRDKIYLSNKFISFDKNCCYLFCNKYINVFKSIFEN